MLKLLLTCLMMPLFMICELTSRDRIGRTSWWSCRGCAPTCFGKVAADVELNLAAAYCRCPCEGRASYPAEISTFENLLNGLRANNLDIAMQAQENPLTQPFDEQMELVANILIQKSRYCVFDLGSFHLLYSLIYNVNPLSDNYE